MRIQRCWRRSGAMGKAVEEVLKLKRERSNPFVSCESAHEVNIGVPSFVLFFNYIFMGM